VKEEKAVHKATFVLLIGFAMTSCSTTSQTNALNTLGDASRKSYECAQTLKSRIQIPFDRIQWTKDISSLPEEEKREFIASQIYPLLPEPEQSAVAAAYMDGSVEEHGRDMIITLLTRVEKLNLCKSRDSFFDGFIFEDVLTELLYKNGVDVEALYVPPADQSHGTLISSDMVVVYLIRQGQIISQGSKTSDKK